MDTVESKAASSQPPAPALPAQTPVATVTQRTPVRRALFNAPMPHVPVRRTKSEGQVRTASAERDESAVPEVCTDATMNDRLWSKLDPGSHRDSVSSSSSISSNDTVIDLSLPNLVRKSLTSLPMGGGTSEPPWVNRPRSAIVSYEAPRAVSKSKSNPNLRQGDPPGDELQSRPLGAPREDALMDSPSRTAQRRHTWSRLYMEGLRQSSAAASSARRPPVAPSPSSSMSKSLGDLTSDDIACNFDSKYRSISRSFIVRPTREQLRRGGPQKLRPPSDLTEQLRRLTDVEPLTASDFSPRTAHAEPREEEVVMDEPPLRRTSSRSQSRVRYIANRAKQAQERQRLQSLALGRNASVSGSISSSGSASPIEERGNPEGACCVARSPCSSLDLLSQLAPVGSPSTQQPQSSPDPENNEVFFMLKL